MKKIKIIGVFLLAILLLGGSLSAQQIPNKSPDELRIIKLKIVADQGYQNYIPDWQKEMAEIVNAASQSLEEQVGIKLEIVEFASWQRKTKGRQNFKILSQELLEAFPRTKTVNFDIVAGLTPESISHGARTYSGYIVINVMGKYKNTDIYYWFSSSSRQQIFPSVILHELGHVFGCYDEEDEEGKCCAMFRYADAYPTTFCKNCLEIIKKYKWRKFPIVEGGVEKDKISLY